MLIENSRTRFLCLIILVFLPTGADHNFTEFDKIMATYLTVLGAICYGHTITPIHEKQWFRIALSKYGGTWGPTNSNINIKPFLALGRLMGL